MNIHCTRTDCPGLVNSFAEEDDNDILQSMSPVSCEACGIPLILERRYRLLKFLGQGAFGATFLAQDLGFPSKRHCVVKQLQPNLNPSQNETEGRLYQLETAKRLFKSEAEVMEKLGHHPHIPTLFAYFELSVADRHSNNPQEFFYLVQEYVDGHDLQQELKQKRKFSEASVLEVLQQLLPVLQYVHDRNAIHRDIKPSNIVRDRHNHRLYLIDFGAVKQMIQEVAGSSPESSSAPLTCIGTRGFASPEQMSGNEISLSTDLYALAATCLCLLSGKMPPKQFDLNGESGQRWRSSIQVSSDLAAILDKMLLSNPRERFQSAAEVMEALSRITIPPETKSTAANAAIPPLQADDASTVLMPVMQPPKLVENGQSAQPPLSTKALQPTRIDKGQSAQFLPPKFSIPELLFGAALTGFEGCLLAIALGSLLPSSISMGLVGMILGGLIFVQSRRKIANIHLFIISIITLTIVLLIPALRTWPIERPGLQGLLSVVMLAIMAGSLAIFLMALYQLYYKLMNKN